jgi:hypothetical protein
MPAHAGQYMRILGLLMEMFGLSSIALASGDGSRHWFGMTSNQVWTIVVVGFVFWAAGTLFNMNEAARRRSRSDDDVS